MKNRNEQLIPSKDGKGVLCDWRWTSRLHIARVFPSLGLRLMKRALKEWPIILNSNHSKQGGDIDVSFIIGHRGKERLPHLLLTLQSIASQRKVSHECIVVEQSSTPEIKDSLPEWVQYLYAPLPSPDMPYSRSRAFNVGARHARGKLLILHDNDLLVPQDYAICHLENMRKKYEVINLKRFIFYLTRSSTDKILRTKLLNHDTPPAYVLQNAEGGGSLVITRDAYFAIGGFDEGFIGWGGEDNELWERALTRSVLLYGFLPMIHLWHAPSQDKLIPICSSVEYFQSRMAIPVENRINELILRNFGNYI